MNFGFLLDIISRYYYLCFVLHNAPLNVEKSVITSAIATRLFRTESTADIISAFLRLFFFIRVATFWAGTCRETCPLVCT